MARYCRDDAAGHRKLSTVSSQTICPFSRISRTHIDTRDSHISRGTLAPITRISMRTRSRAPRGRRRRSRLHYRNNRGRRVTVTSEEERTQIIARTTLPVQCNRIGAMARSFVCAEAFSNMDAHVRLQLVSRSLLVPQILLALATRDTHHRPMHCSCDDD